MLLQDVIYDIREEKSKKVAELQYDEAATLRDLEITLLQNFAKILEFTNDIETKDVYLNSLNRALDEIIKYNIELTNDEAYTLCVNYNNVEYIQRFIKLKMLNGTK